LSGEGFGLGARRVEERVEGADGWRADAEDGGGGEGKVREKGEDGGEEVGSRAGGVEGGLHAGGGGDDAAEDGDEDG